MQDPTTKDYAQPLLLTPTELGRLLGIGRNKSYELIASGTLPVIRFGRAIRIPRIAVEQWIEKQTRCGEN